MNQQTIFERLKNGEIIHSKDGDIEKIRQACYKTKKLLLELNATADPIQVRQLLAQITDTKIDESVAIFTPWHVNYGKNTQFGKNIFVNFDCIFLDLGGIVIEDNVQIAPKVSLLTEGHPLDVQIRHSLLAKPIHIKKNAWIGANTTILQGVTIGENSIVAAGSIVSENVPDNVIVAGTPAKIIKELL